MLWHLLVAGRPPGQLLVVIEGALMLELEKGCRGGVEHYMLLRRGLILIITAVREVAFGH